MQKVEDWEVNLQRVDKILFRWMDNETISKTSPSKCISILEKEGYYNPTNRPGRPLREDLRAAREASGVKDNKPFDYCTEHLKFEQEAKKKHWLISLRAR